VPNGEGRLKEAVTHGFRRAIVPKANAPKKPRIGEMEIIAVDRLADALSAAWNMQGARQNKQRRAYISVRTRHSCEGQDAALRRAQRISAKAPIVATRTIPWIQWERDSHQFQDSLAEQKCSREPKRRLPQARRA
jgi:hypothetical protein